MIALLKQLEVRTRGEAPGLELRLASHAAEALHVPADAVLRCEPLHIAVDSRRGEPRLVCQLKVELPDSFAGRVPAAAKEELLSLEPKLPEIPCHVTLRHPLVVGTGPAGIFGALTLAMAGAEPVILDRGAPVEQRCAGYDAFLRTRELDEESNLLIGEGGAGTFSDGKLYTGTRDARAGFVRRVLAEAGAPPEILWRSRPHVGSDYLRRTAAGLRKKVEALGGRFLFHTAVSDIRVRDSRCCGVVTSAGEFIGAPSVLMAPGLGGRELVRAVAAKAEYALKPFQIGCRIEHPQEFVDLSQYHVPRPAALGAAEYHIVSRAGERNVSSFCMCPGGEVVNATAWKNHSISNGMSEFARASGFADSCLIVTLSPEEAGSLAAVQGLFDRIETGLFRMGGSDYTLPAQDAAAFLAGRAGLTQRRTSCRVGIVPGRLDELLPRAVRDALRCALADFDRRLPGFVSRGKFIGVESCVSSPLRFLRRETGESSLDGLYLSGEGAGAAGGIVSAACDGIACAEHMLKQL